MSDKQKFYNTNWFMWLTLILLAPVGIFFMWKNQKYTKKVRGILSGVFAVWFLIMASGANGSSNSIQNINNQAATNKAMESKDNKSQGTTTPATQTSTSDNKTTSNETSNITTPSGNSNSVQPPVQVKPTPAPSQNKSITVYVTNTGKKYHVAGCRYLSKSQIPISLNDAKADGYDPCSVCNPPQ